jgi:hypothetical protein
MKYLETWGDLSHCLRFLSEKRHDRPAPRRRPPPALRRPLGAGRGGLRTGASRAQAAAGRQSSRAAGRQHTPRSPPPPSRRRARAPARRRWAGKARDGRATGMPGALLSRRARSASGTATQCTRRNDSPNQVGAGYSPYLLGICGHGAAGTLIGAPRDPRAHRARRVHCWGAWHAD